MIVYVGFTPEELRIMWKSVETIRLQLTESERKETIEFLVKKLEIYYEQATR